MLLLQKSKDRAPSDSRRAPAQDMYSEALGPRPSAPAEQKDTSSKTPANGADFVLNSSQLRRADEWVQNDIARRQRGEIDPGAAYLNPQKWSTWNSQNPDHIDTKATGASGGVPHSSSCPPLGTLSEDPEVPEGVSYDYAHLTPPGKFQSGIFYDPASGRRWFAKKGLVESPDQHAHAIKNPNDWRFSSGRFPDPLPRNYAARHEHTVHRLYDFFSTPENGIRSVNGTLHSDQNNGAAVSDTYQWKPNIAAYSVTPELFGRNRQRAQTLFDVPHDIAAEYEKDKLNGIAVDALLAAGDTHNGNWMVVPGERGLFRIDTGAHLGMTPFGYKNLHGFHKSDQLIGASVLPDLVNLVSEIYHYDLAGKDKPKTTKEKIQFSQNLGSNILGQIRHIITMVDNEPESFRRALVHHHDRDDVYRHLITRIDVYRTMLDKYKDDPAALGATLIGFNMNSLQKPSRMTKSIMSKPLFFSNTNIRPVTISSRKTIYDMAQDVLNFNSYYRGHK